MNWRERIGMIAGVLGTIFIVFQTFEARVDNLTQVIVGGLQNMDDTNQDIHKELLSLAQRVKRLECATCLDQCRNQDCEPGE